MPVERSVRVTDSLRIPLDDIEFTAVRAQGPGGQHVNKASTAVQLRFDLRDCAAFDDDQRERLLALKDRRISGDGVVVIRAQRFRSREKNRLDALDRLAALVLRGLTTHKPRKATRPGRAAVKRRLDAKSRRGRLKADRRKVDD